MSAPPAVEHGEILFVGGRIHAVPGAPSVEAILVRGDRVVAIGGEADVRAAAPRASVVDLAGATVTPGLTDAHTHPTAWALGRRRVDLRGAASPAEAVERVRRAAPSVGDWVLGQGWSEHDWGGLPDRELLDRAVPGRPVLLDSHDLHVSWLNAEALRRCGIDRDTPDPAGGEIVRDAVTGEPTGVLREEARKRAVARLPEPDFEEVIGALLEAQAEAHRLGITGVHSVEATGLRDVGTLYERGLLRLRVLQHLPVDGLEEAIERGLRSGDPLPDAPDSAPWVRIGGVKMFLDGALGSRTAWLREPYVGESAYRGIQTLEESAFRQAVRRAAEAGLASAVHAIGDAAVELALAVLQESRPPDALPHRIEHLQLCPPDLWARAAGSGIVASMQPVHLLTDIPAAERHWGHERCRGAYPFAPLLAQGMTLAFGSDVPVETIDPRPGLLAATRRVTWSGAWEGGEWYPEHALTRAEALAGYTVGPARAARCEDRSGSLLPGYDADLVVWDQDPLTASPEALLSMRCLLTLVGGEVVHREGI